MGMGTMVTWYDRGALLEYVRSHLARAPELETRREPTKHATGQQVVAFFPTTIRRAFSTMSQLGIRIEY